ncbi:hypothetical protein CR513_50333, partial [Mucuna pruriens]
MVSSKLPEHGFKRSKSEPTLYIKTQGQYDTLIVYLYKTFEMINLGKSVATPLVTNEKLQKDDGTPKVDAL